MTNRGDGVLFPRISKEKVRIKLDVVAKIPPIPNATKNPFVV